MKRKSAEEAKEVNEHVMANMLNWAYDAAVNGIPGLGTAEDLANHFLQGNKPLEKNKQLNPMAKCKMCNFGIFIRFGWCSCIACHVTCWYYNYNLCTDTNDSCNSIYGRL